MKILLTCFLGLFACAASAQQYAIQTLISSQNIPGGATSNYTAVTTAVIPLTKYDKTTLFGTWKLDGAGTNNVVLTFDRSVDGTNWDTKDPYVFTVPNTGTTTVNWLTNLTVDTMGYIRLKTIVNGTAGQAMTNLTIKAATKPKLQG
jgi:hypothetical protein